MDDRPTISPADLARLREARDELAEASRQQKIADRLAARLPPPTTPPCPPPTLAQRMELMEAIQDRTLAALAESQAGLAELREHLATAREESAELKRRLLRMREWILENVTPKSAPPAQPKGSVSK